MSHTERLKEQNERIRKYIATESVHLSDGRSFITEDDLWHVWMRELGDGDSKTELDEFQECVPSSDLARNLYSAIKILSTLICIHWDKWQEFPERFCRITGTATLDDVQDLDARLPFDEDALIRLLFPEDPSCAKDFFAQQFVFLTLLLEEDAPLQTYPGEYCLPLLDDSNDSDLAHQSRISAVKIAVGHFRSGSDKTINQTPKAVCRKRVRGEIDLDLELQNLAALRGTGESNENVARHLMAVRLGSEYNIFYDEAALDLEGLLNGEYHNHFSDGDMAPQPLVSQATNLVAALDFLNNKLIASYPTPSCCHLELSPTSVMIRTNPRCPVGKWMLMDFGIAVIKPEAEAAIASTDDRHDVRQMSGTAVRSVRYPNAYQPPEMERNRNRSREEHIYKGNIWSLGCILLVILVFSIGGPSFVRRLQVGKEEEDQTDYYYVTITSGGNQIQRVKPQLKSWVSQLTSHHGQWASAWLRLVVDNMLQISPLQRLDGKHLQDQLDTLRKQSVTENVWSNTPQDLEIRSGSQSPAVGQSGSSEDHDRRPSWVSILSSRRPSAAQTSAGQASTPELAPASVATRDLDVDPLMIVHDTPGFKSTPLSQINSEEAENSASSRALQLQPTEEVVLREAVPDVEDLKLLSDAEWLVFWHEQGVMPCHNVSGVFRATSSLSPNDPNGTGSHTNESKKSTKWIHVSLSGPYMALVKSAPSSTQITVMDLEHWQVVQPNTAWPSLEGLRSASVSCQGSVAFFYDKVVKFRCTRENAYLRNSTWSTSSENICAGTFSRDGRKFFAVSWTQLWIGTVEQNRWVLRASGDHHLSARAYLSFRPYLIPFSSREALFAHNPAEEKLCYLEARTSTKVDLGSGVLRVAISEFEDTILYIRQHRRGNRPRFLPQASFYGLSWRTMTRSQAGQITLGRENEVIDLHLPVEKNKQFTLTSFVGSSDDVADESATAGGGGDVVHANEGGSTGGSFLTVWVVTNKGEVRKCRLATTTSTTTPSLDRH